MNPEEELRALRDRFPLPDDASLMDPFVESVDVCGVVIHTVGLGAEFRGECITGSAGALTEPPVVRAYMELLERLALVSVETATAREQPEPAWRPARSNGVAIGVTRADAARRARFELIERDRVLRSWYGEGAPFRVPLDSLVPVGLLDLYDFEACLFEVAHGTHTAGVFGFPRTDAPLVYGFAARGGVRGALQGALDECLQRLGFLWGEPVPERAPSPAPTPSFHQDHYLYPGHHEVLRRWLRGGHENHSGGLQVQRLAARPSIEDLRPTWLSPSLHVVRASPRGHVPLCFGPVHPMIAGSLTAESAVHPVV